MNNNNNNDVLDFLDSLDSVAPAPPAATSSASPSPSPVMGMGGHNPFAPVAPVTANNNNPFLASTSAVPAAAAAATPTTITSPSPQVQVQPAPIVAPIIAPPANATVTNVANVASPKLGHARSGSSSSLRDRAGTPVNVNMPPLTGSASGAGSGSVSLPRPSTPAAATATSSSSSASNPQLNPYTPPPATASSSSASPSHPASTPAQQQQPQQLQAGGWSSWFSSVTATVSTVVSPDLVSRATQAAAKVGDQLLHETQHAQAVASRALTQASSVAATVTAQARDRANNNATAAAAVAQGSKLFGMVSQSVNGLLDVVAPETLELAVTLKLAGMCNVDEVAKDTTQVLETVFAARDMRLIVAETDATGLRKFLPEESPDFTPEVAWAKIHSASADPIPDTHIHVYIHPMLPLPTACSTSLLTYLVRVTGSGAFSAVTVSQSFHTVGPHADAEWTRMVLRSAVRTTVDDWLAELVAADASETRFSAARSRADGATVGAANKGEVVSDEQQLVQAIGSI